MVFVLVIMYIKYRYKLSLYHGHECYRSCTGRPDSFLCLFYSLSPFSLQHVLLFPLKFCSFLLIYMLQEVTKLGLLSPPYFL